MKYEDIEYGKEYLVNGRRMKCCEKNESKGGKLLIFEDEEVVSTLVGSFHDVEPLKEQPKETEQEVLDRYEEEGFKMYHVESIEAKLSILEEMKELINKYNKID